MRDRADVSDLHSLMLRQEKAGSLGAGLRKVDGFNFARDPRNAQQENAQSALSRVQRGYVSRSRRVLLLLCRSPRPMVAQCHTTSVCAVTEQALARERAIIESSLH